MSRHSTLVLTILLLSSPTPAFCKGTNDFFSYQKGVRVQLLKNLREALRTNYSLWYLKKKKIKGFNPAKHFQNAIEKEQEIIDPPDKVQRAKLNIRYLDRLTKLLASFQDTHLKLKAFVSRPFIFNGIRVAEINGKFYVVALNKQIMEYNQKSLKKYNFHHLSLGDEVVSIDRKPIEDKINWLSSFVSSSSSLAKRRGATTALGYRNFSYPIRNHNILTFRSQKDGSIYELKVPYYYQKNMRVDVKIYFESLQLKSLDELRVKWVTTADTWEKVQLGEWQGWSFKEKPDNYWQESYYSFKKKNPQDLTYRLGITIDQGKAYGLLQLFSFKPKKIMNETGKKTNYFKPIIDFLKVLEKNKTPLILDLRQNTGGKGIYASFLLGHLSEARASYLPTSWMYRITPAVQQMIETRELKKVSPKNTSEIHWMVQSLNQAKKLNASYMPPFQRTSKITASREVGGFHQKIVALISPKCVSACDIMASLLHHSKRATLIGQPSNGTGAGARTLHPFNGTTWNDNHKILAINIPNFLFGYPFAIKESSKVLDLVLQYSLENVPTSPSIEHSPTLSDYLEKSKDILKIAQETLNK